MLANTEAARKEEEEENAQLRQTIATLRAKIAVLEARVG